MAEYFLENTHSPVFGMSRNCTIEHKNYTHCSMDLSQNKAIQNFSWPRLEQVKSWVLINNAGSLGPVGPLTKIEGDDFATLLQLNVVSPTLLMAKCLIETKGLGTIINISSGAGKYPVAGWAAYGSSKAALDLASEIAAKENPKAYIRSISPGVIDTPMQGEIRKSSASDFPAVQSFIEYKQSGELVSPAMVAKKIVYVLNNPKVAPNTLFSLRDLNP